MYGLYGSSGHKNMQRRIYVSLKSIYKRILLKLCFARPVMWHCRLKIQHFEQSLFLYYTDGGVNLAYLWRQTQKAICGGKCRKLSQGGITRNIIITILSMTYGETCSGVRVPGGVFECICMLVSTPDSGSLYEANLYSAWWRIYIDFSKLKLVFPAQHIVIVYKSSLHRNYRSLVCTARCSMRILGA